MPDLLGFFIDDFILFINEMATQHRILIVVDFNLDQMLPKHVTEVDLVIQNFNLSQRSLTVLNSYTWEILDLVFDTSNYNIASSFPSS